MTAPSGDGADRYALWDASYLLGSLTSSERREYENHLTGCYSCRAAVGDLSGVPALLAMLTPADMAAIDESSAGGGTGASVVPPTVHPRLLDDLLDNVRRHRRRMRWMTWASTAAAAALVLGGGVIAFKPDSSVQPAEPSVHASATPLRMTPVAPSSVEATVSMTSRSWGTYVVLSCTYRDEKPPIGDDDDAGDRLEMVAVGRDGSRAQLATWIAREGVTATPTGSTSMPIDAIGAVQVVSTDTGDVLLERNF